MEAFTKREENTGQTEEDLSEHIKNQSTLNNMTLSFNDFTYRNVVVSNIL